MITTTVKRPSITRCKAMKPYAYTANGNRTGNQTHGGLTISTTVTSGNMVSTDGVYNYTWDAENN